MQAPRFIRNLYEMATREDYEEAIAFSTDGMCLELKDNNLFKTKVMPQYFKHQNLNSFIRQLNNYGFKHIGKYSSFSDSREIVYERID
jgi:hypothetical protein